MSCEIVVSFSEIVLSQQKPFKYSSKTIVIITCIVLLVEKLSQNRKFQSNILIKCLLTQSIDNLTVWHLHESVYAP